MNKKSIIFPKHREILDILGENIKLARLRRKLTASQVAERANIVRSTLYLIEKGSETVAIGHYFNVLRALNLHLDFLKLASDDVLGRKLQDLELLDQEVPEIGVFSDYVSHVTELEESNSKRVKKIKQTYLMINSDGHVKIGKSSTPEKREKTLQSQQPCINLYAVGTLNVEKELHEKFKDKRIRGEWFDLNLDEIKSIIEEYGFIEIKDVISQREKDLGSD